MVFIRFKQSVGISRINFVHIAMNQMLKNPLPLSRGFHQLYSLVYYLISVGLSLFFLLFFFASASCIIAS